MKDKKFFLSFILLTLFVYLNVKGNPVSNENVPSKKEWKTNELHPDLNKDGVKDKLVLMYLIEQDKVITKFIPYIIDNEGKTVKKEEINKNFGKVDFDNEFNNFLVEFIENYPKKEEVSKNTTENEKNPIPEDLKKEIDVNDKSEILVDKRDNTVDEGKQLGKNTKGSYEYIDYYAKDRPKNLTFNYKYDKNSPKDMDDFIFIKTGTAIRKEPNAKSGVLKNASYGQKYKVIGKVKTNVSEGKSEWYEVSFDGKLGYVLTTNAIKREFDWHDMMKKVERTNKFIKEAVEKNRKIYVLDDYTPLGGGSGGNKDKYGNRENQSERGYLSSSFKEFINIPDRAMMVITEETDKYVKVKIDVYDNKEYYLQKANRKILKDTGIDKEISRFIYVDRHSQNEMIIEKDTSSGNWNVVTSSFVTTGKDGSDSYATPYGAFLIAYSKPVMQYTGSDGKTVAGDAKNAVRFSGGGYMHSIPSLFEPKETRNQRKAATAKKIGTYPESHKCIRHYDDQIKFIYDWLGNASPGDKNGFRVPEVPTVMIVK